MFQSLLLICLAVTVKAIIHGEVVNEPKAYPNHVFLNVSQTYDKGICGGRLIHPQWILTSKRCTNAITSLDIFLNTADIKKPVKVIHITNLAEAIWEDPSKIGNLALIKMPTPYQSPEPPSLDSLSEVDVTDNQKGLLIGLGSEPETRELLTEGSFTILSRGKCEELNAFLLDQSDFCVLGWDNGPQIPCDGNGGEALILPNNKLQGIFISPYSCLSNIPAVFTNIAPFAKEIKNNILGL